MKNLTADDSLESKERVSLFDPSGFIAEHQCDF